MHQEASTRLRTRVERGVYRRNTRAGDARYEIAYLDSDGCQRWATTGSLREARVLRADLVAKAHRGELRGTTKETLSEYAERWLERQKPRLRPKTYELYRSYLRLHVVPRFGTRRLRSITVDDIASLISEMQDGIRYGSCDGKMVRREGKPFSGWTIRGVLVVLGRLFGTAVRDGLIYTNPVRRLESSERPRTKRRELPSLDREAIGRLIASTPKRYRTLVAVSVLTGVRQSEALGLRWQDIDLKADVIRIRHQLSRSGELVEPKTPRADRNIPIPPSLTQLLLRHKEAAFARGFASSTDFVFASEAGSPLHYRNVCRRGLAKALDAAGLPKLRWHDLRHIAASALIAQGASVPYISRILGHSTPAVTLGIYAHEFAAVEHADRAREQMEAAFRGDLPCAKTSRARIELSAMGLRTQDASSFSPPCSFPTPSPVSLGLS